MIKHIKAFFELPDSKQKILAREVIDRYKGGETHPVSALYQLSQVLQFQMDLKETVTTAGITGFYFAFCVVIDGVQYKTGMGITKKEARAKAAELALEELEVSSEHAGIPSEVSEVSLTVRDKDSVIPEVHSGRAVMERKNPLKDQVPSAVREIFTRLMDSYPEFSACGGTAAAFVMQSPTGCEVIALGTGCSNTKASPAPTGRILHDSHAVVTARRSLMRFLYKNLLLFFSKNPSLEEKSVFQQDQTTKLLSFKNHLSLHLYLSQLPKGAAQIPSQLRLNPLSISAWEVNNQIGLHVVVEGKVFSKFSSSYEQMGSHVVSMSATDKITQWLVLGFQGALLSHFIEPVYVNSVFVGEGGCSDVRGLQMAVSQRVDGITSTLPLYYCVYRPLISLVTSAVPIDTQPSQKSLSFNWSHGDITTEAVDALEGRSSEDSPFKSSPALASRLCKAAMLSRFNLVAKEAQREELLAAVTYREAKMMAKPYQEAKSVLKSYLARKGYGHWVEKPPISDHFA
ncbi:Adenosine deaminase domain-containing protein 1 [Triplophysa tibetana]|uniref:Adenosine deaminase domain-containing protein 1 n=1 Tax=Triplophysa tibetana TaxID=1572043 RepID=A0A5A9NK12_9TELE|nr:Adenosine deaminase domain-containing protein 1 [Triplophysa tibetana]